MRNRNPSPVVHLWAVHTTARNLPSPVSWHGNTLGKDDASNLIVTSEGWAPQPEEPIDF